ncbi:MAG TPA: CAP domain-containing protein [Thermodesulfobacteriaceae bacterium]|nr:CAP domain-containing protein [Thermodesulfobacteriaceae bacterium]
MLKGLSKKVLGSPLLPSIITGIICFCMWIMPFMAGAVETVETVNGSPAPTQEDVLFQRINQARLDPWAEAGRLGLDQNHLRQSVVSAEIIQQWDSGLYPVVRNSVLDDLAAAHCQDMINRRYYSDVTPEGLTPVDRALYAGYPVMDVREVYGAMAFQFFVRPEQAGRNIMDSLMRKALMQEVSPGGQAIFDNDMVEVGISLKGGMVYFQGLWYNQYVLCIVFARPGDESPYLLQHGHIFDDMNHNGTYDPGEGVAGIEIYDIYRNLLAVSGEKGAYSLRQIHGPWIVVICNCWRKQVNGVDPRIVLEEGAVVERDYCARDFWCPGGN